MKKSDILSLHHGEDFNTELKCFRSKHLEVESLPGDHIPITAKNQVKLHPLQGEPHPQSLTESQMKTWLGNQFQMNLARNSCPLNYLLMFRVLSGGWYGGILPSKWQPQGRTDGSFDDELEFDQLIPEKPKYFYFKHFFTTDSEKKI